MSTEERFVHPAMPDLPARIARLPVDPRGFPIPWFVATLADGSRDFRVTGGLKIRLAIEKSLCWICGDILGVHRTYVIGPMCVVNRISAEPPSHQECAVFAAQACPFLTKPSVTRRTDGLPEGTGDLPGVAIKRNPGVVCCWTTRWPTEPFDVDGGVLFELPDHEEISWWCRGRLATQAEVQESVNTGFPALLEAAQIDGPSAVKELYDGLRAAAEFFPYPEVES